MKKIVLILAAIIIPGFAASALCSPLREVVGPSGNILDPNPDGSLSVVLSTPLAVALPGVTPVIVVNPTSTIINDVLVHQSESTTTWVYVSSAVTESGNHIELGATNKAHTYTVTAQGGFGTFRINQGELIFVNDGETESEIMSPFEIFPATINVIDLQSGATLFVKLTGGKK